MKTPSKLTVVRFTAFVAFVVFGIVTDRRFSMLAIPAFIVFLIATLMSMREMGKQIDVRGLKRLRDIFPRNDDRK